VSLFQVQFVLFCFPWRCSHSDLWINLVQIIHDYIVSCFASDARLSEVLQTLKSQSGKFAKVIADVGDEGSLVQMCSQARVVLNCVGPYRFYGEAVVRACIAGGAHYLDITGEPEFMERVELKYGKAAADKARLLFVCLFVSPARGALCQCVTTACLRCCWGWLCISEAGEVASHAFALSCLL
jgi:hypothetical protein